MRRNKPSRNQIKQGAAVSIHEKLQESDKFQGQRVVCVNFIVVQQLLLV